MKEDLSIAKNNILLLNEENTNLKKQLASKDLKEGGNGEDTRAKKSNYFEINEMRHQLELEKKHNQEIEKELDLQVCFTLIKLLFLFHLS